MKATGLSRLAALLWRQGNKRDNQSFREVFIIGFRIAAPITASILIANVALGVISKAVPQVNIFILGLPVKIALGIAVMIITIPLLITFLEELYGGIGGETLRFLESVAP